jgi:uncharacterized protein
MRATAMMKVREYIILLSAFLLLSSCAMRTDLYRDIEQSLASGNYAVAASALKANEEEFGESNSVLFNLELGLLTHYGAQYPESNRLFLAAERKMEELYTKSISTEAAALLVNDNVLPYEGEDFEKVFVNLFLALNFAQMGNIEEALVEARKVDLKLKEYSKQYEGKNTYKQDAFIRYVMGALYEAGGEINDAFISYRKAYEGYDEYAKAYGTSCPTFLKADLVRTAGQLGFDDERRQLEKQFGTKYSRPKQKEGALLAIIYSGRGPVKEQNKIRVSIPDEDGVVHTFTVALPKFVARGKGQARYDASLQGGGQSMRITAEIAEDVTEIAKKSLEDRLALLYLKAGGRAVLKYLASEKAKKEWKKENDELGNLAKSLLIDAAVIASEQADTRTWRSLPDRMLIIRAQLPAGTHNLQLSAEGQSRSLLAEQVTIVAGGVTFRIITDVN